MASVALNFGLLADTTAQLDDLREIVERIGYHVSSAIQISSSVLPELPEVDAWVVSLSLQNEDAVDLVDALDVLPVPVIFDDIESYSSLGKEERQKRFTNKIHLCIGSDERPSFEKKRAREVWVLAASTGGPEAVSRFLSLLPDHISGVAFIYVQHIYVETSATLSRAISRHTKWQLFSSDKPHTLYEGCIYIISPQHQVEFDHTGVLLPTSESWSGPYSPSIDQVIAKAARQFGKCSGAIIFSGMGEDGANSCRFMKKFGGIVWVQRPDSCAIDSMPLSALKTNCVSYSGSPEMLARQFVHGRHLASNLSTDTSK